MKKLLLTLGLLCLLAGCASQTVYGPCVGLWDQHNPKLTYKPSARNLIVGIVFFEFIAPPIVVAVNEIECPVGVMTNVNVPVR
jgi:hypothetical protein